MRTWSEHAGFGVEAEVIHPIGADRCLLAARSEYQKAAIIRQVC
jgi:hypothetical protein